MPSSDSDGQPPRRKRSRISAEGDAGKKARGRPRVDTQDETAADRRRTQIRLAQRAYRQRKETTIASLQDKNARLQRIIDQMNQSFVQFNHAAIKSGLAQTNPNLGQQLRQVTENFATLTKNAAAEASLNGEEHHGEGTINSAGEAHASSELQQEDQVSRDSTQAQPHCIDIGWGYSAALAEGARQNIAKPSGRDSQEHEDSSLSLPTMPNTPFSSERTGAMKLRPSVHAGHIMDQAVPWSSTNTPDLQSQNSFCIMDILSRQQYSPPVSNPQIYTLDMSTPSLTPPYVPSFPRTLPTPWTYSHNETTFARRLTRASLEEGFHLLCSATKSPAALKYIFRLSVHKDLDELRERFKELLTRGTDEDLDKWDSPFAHIGGAGTHFPRKDAKGNTVNISNHWKVRQIGNMVRAENLVDPSKSYDADFTGYGGEWFDAFDVEGYLEQKKGCKIDPTSSFAQIFIDDDDDVVAYEAENNSNIAGNFKSNYSYARSASDSNSEPPSFRRGSSNASSVSTSPTNESEHFYTKSNATNLAMDAENMRNTNSMNANASMHFTPTDYEKYAEILSQPLGADLSGMTFDMPPSTHLPHMDFNTVNNNVSREKIGMDSGNLPIVRQKKKKAVWVDVNLLVKKIVSNGVCLGRAPGYRRRDVDRAFQLSLVPAC